MEGTGSVSIIKWPILRRRRILVGVVMTVVVTMLMVMSQSARRTSPFDGNDGSVAKDFQSFIPNRPRQLRIGKPADIPRRFLIEEADACLRKGDDVDVVAYVHSAISRVDKRRQTRLTWANSTALKMVVVFMVGRAKNNDEREIVRRESELYHDIVQGDYGDHYHLLSYKALSSLYWITRNCAHVPWTLHADDDLLIDTFFLQKYMQEKEDSEKDKLHCRMAWDGIVMRRGKWKVSRKELKDKIYPPYCQGFIWFTSTDQVPNLLNASTVVNFLWVDDVYVTGYLAKELKIEFSDIREYIEKDTFNRTHLGKRLAWYHIKEEERMRLWPLILHHNNFTDGESPDSREEG